MTNEFVLNTPHWGTGSEWYWAFWQFVVVALTLAFIARQVWIQTKQAKVEAANHVVHTVCTLQERWNADGMQRARLDVCTKWKNSSRDFDGASEYIAEFMEELATFVKVDAVPEEIMWDVQSWNVECYWFMFEEGVKKLRTEYKDNTYYTGFEFLFERMSAVGEKKRVPAKNQKDIDDFIEREIRSANACIDFKQANIVGNKGVINYWGKER